MIVGALHQLKRSLCHVVERQSGLDSCDLNRVPCLQTDSLQVTHEVTVRSEPILCFSAHTHTYKYTVSVNKPKSCMKFTYESMHILCSTFDVNTHTHTHTNMHTYVHRIFFDYMEKVHIATLNPHSIYSHVMSTF